MHTFPQLRKIERKYGDRVIVIGVHSPKFPAERETANLREAVLRYRIEHPIVNDRDCRLEPIRRPRLADADVRRPARPGHRQTGG